jgi:hypothetical protein
VQKPAFVLVAALIAISLGHFSAPIPLDKEFALSR